MIEEIKDSIPHDDDCAGLPSMDEVFHNLPTNRECNCTRREMIAYLERLQEPTTKMVEAFYRAHERLLSTDRWESPFGNGWEALLAAAEEAK